MCFASHGVELRCGLDVINRNALVLVTCASGCNKNEFVCKITIYTCVALISFVACAADNALSAHSSM
jgi:hypothetical protein